MTRFQFKALAVCIFAVGCVAAIAVYRWANQMPITLEALGWPLGYLTVIAVVSGLMGRWERKGRRPGVVRGSDFLGHMVLAVLLIVVACVTGWFVVDAVQTGLASPLFSSTTRSAIGDNPAGFLLTLALQSLLLVYVLFQLFLSISKVRKFLGRRNGPAGA